MSGLCSRKRDLPFGTAARMKMICWFDSWLDEQPTIKLANKSIIFRESKVL
jgi:hypothetical protein